MASDRLWKILGKGGDQFGVCRPYRICGFWRPEPGLLPEQNSLHWHYISFRLPGSLFCGSSACCAIGLVNRKTDSLPASISDLLALVLLIGSYYISWSFAGLPVWVLLISSYILIDNLRRQTKG